MNFGCQADVFQIFHHWQYLFVVRHFKAKVRSPLSNRHSRLRADSHRTLQHICKPRKPTAKSQPCKRAAITDAPKNPQPNKQKVHDIISTHQVCIGT